MKPKVAADLFFHIVMNTWFCASDADWMIRCGRGTQKSMQMSVRWWAEFNNRRLMIHWKMIGLNITGQNI